MSNTEGPNLAVMVAISLVFMGGAFLLTNTRPDPSSPVLNLLLSSKDHTSKLKDQIENAHKIQSQLLLTMGKGIVDDEKVRIQEDDNLIASKITYIKNEIAAMLPPPVSCQCQDQDMYRAQELHSFATVRNAALYSIALPEIKKNCPYVEAFELQNLSDDKLQPYNEKSQRLIRFGDTYGIRTMVETGTYYGGTSSDCSSHFDKLYTIELSKELFDRVSPAFAGTKVQAFNGDSSEVLKEKVLPFLQDSTIFWLDGHYSSTGTARGSVDTPIFSELMQILTHPLASKFILVIDDMRLFRGYTPECMLKSSEDTQCYPSISDIAEIFCAYQSTTKMTVKVEGDALIAIGGDLKAKK